MAITDRETLIGGFFELYFVENEGMAFGMKLEGDWGKLALSLFRIGCVVLIAFYLRNLIRKKAHTGLITAIAFIFAGALGNIIDSMFYGMIFTESARYNDIVATFGEGYASMKPMGGFLYGKVVDMLHFTVRWPSGMPWLGGGEVFGPIFNIADVSISIGVGMIIIKQKKFFAKKKDEEAEEEASNTPDEMIADGTPVNEEATTLESTSAADTPSSESEPVPKPQATEEASDASKEAPAAESDVPDEA